MATLTGSIFPGSNGWRKIAGKGIKPQRKGREKKKVAVGKFFLFATIIFLRGERGGDRKRRKWRPGTEKRRKKRRKRER